MSMLYHFFKKKKIDFQEDFFKYASVWWDKIAYKKGILKECIRSCFLHGSIFCLGICMSVSKPSICFWKWLLQLSGEISCLFTTLIWQVIERVHIAYSSWFSWMYQSLLRFGIGGLSFFPKVTATIISKRFYEIGYKNLLLNIIENKK